MITDSHCHLASHRFESEDLAELINRAKDMGVHRMVTLATCLGDLERNLEIATNPEIGAALGIHPCDVHHAPDEALETIDAHLTDPRVCAVGETGLDYFHPAPEGWSETDFRSRQRDFLEQHFELAARHGLNIVIHTRDKEGSASFDDAFGIYRKYSGKVRAVFHCFISGWEQAKLVIDEGGLVSFGGVTTFKKSQSLRETVAACPAGSFMLETDSPYLAPEPVRGKRNEPAFTGHIAKTIAVARGESPDELAAHTEQAVAKFFRWENSAS
jgi:TatD DNase family protein